MTVFDAQQQIRFAMLALVNELINENQFLETVRLWLDDKMKYVSDVFLETDVLSKSEVEVVQSLLQIQSDKGNTNNDFMAAASLTLRDKLRKLDDQDVNRALRLESNSRFFSTLGQTVSKANQAFTDPSVASDRFRIVQAHARGGLGEVFLAHDEQLHRDVALKLIQAQFAGDQNSSLRFLREAEITGRLEHPGIVPVYGLGTNDDGRPYYAMRFIRGDSLTTAINQFHASPNAIKGDQIGNRSNYHSLEFRKLLNQFVDVCNAVDYAHSRGVLHRDLKPDNIMLGKFGETLVVDWGLAKTIGGLDTEPIEKDESIVQVSSESGTDPTAFGLAMGTPRFMSPEQADGQLDRLGPASDVYSLGATLYMIMTGKSAFESRNREATLDNVRRGEFPKPRQQDFSIPRPLESICLKAMRLEHSDRYQSTSELAADVERFLADEKVAEHDESLSERMGRFGRRHRALVWAAAAVMFLTMTVSVVAAININRQKRLTDRYLQSLEIYKEAFRGIHDPEAPVAGALDFMVLKIESKFGEDPISLMPSLKTIADTYMSIGRYESAKNIYKRIVELGTDQLGPDNPKILAASSALSEAEFSLGDFDAAELLVTETLAKARRALGNDHEVTLECLNTRALLYEQQGKIQNAKDLYESILRTLPDENPDRLMVLQNYARVAPKNEQKQILEDILLLGIRLLGENHPDVLLWKNNLAFYYGASGATQQAIELLESVVKASKDKLGIEHPDTQTRMISLARYYSDEGEKKKAADSLKEVLDVRQAGVVDDLTSLKFTLTNPYCRLTDFEGIAEIIPLFELVLGAHRADDDKSIVPPAMDLITAYRVNGQIDHALPLCEELIGEFRLREGSNGPNTRSFLNWTQNLSLQSKNYVKAEEMSRRWLAVLDGMNDPPKHERPWAISSLAQSLFAQNLYQEAIVRAKAAIEQSSEEDRTKFELWRARNILGAALAKTDDDTEERMDAESLLLSSYEQLKSGIDKWLEHRRWHVARACERVVTFYGDRGDTEQIEKWNNELTEITSKLQEMREAQGWPYR